MKKLAGFLLAATLVFSMTTVAFAAGSKSVTVDNTTVKTEAGEVTVNHDIDSKEATAAGITTDSTTGKSTIADASLATVKTTLNAEKIQVLDVFNVEAPEGFKEGTSVDVTIPGVTYQDGMVVLHYQDGAWVALPTKNVNGKVVATFTKFSPTAIAIVTKAQASTTPDKSTTDTKKATTTDSNKAPKTGEANTVVYVALLALVAGASAVAAKRKFA